MPPMATLPAGTSTRGVSRRGIVKRSGAPVMYGRPGVKPMKYKVLRASVQPHELVHRQLEPPRGGLEVEPELAAVTARQLHLARGRHGRRRRLLGERRELRAERLVADDRRIVVDEQRAVRGDGLDDAGQRLVLDQVLEGADARVDLHA